MSLKAMARSTTCESAEISDLGSIKMRPSRFLCSFGHVSLGNRDEQLPDRKFLFRLNCLGFM
jgi:hypothetical protein